MPSEQAIIEAFIESIPGFVQSEEYAHFREQGTTRAALAHLGDYLERMLLMDRMRETPGFDFQPVARALDEVLQSSEAVNAVKTMFIEDYLFPGDPLEKVLVPLTSAQTRDIVDRHLEYMKGG